MYVKTYAQWRSPNEIAVHDPEGIGTAVTLHTRLYIYSGMISPGISNGARARGA